MIAIAGGAPERLTLWARGLCPRDDAVLALTARRRPDSGGWSARCDFPNAFSVAAMPPTGATVKEAESCATLRSVAASSFAFPSTEGRQRELRAAAMRKRAESAEIESGIATPWWQGPRNLAALPRVR